MPTKSWKLNYSAFYLFSPVCCVSFHYVEFVDGSFCKCIWNVPAQCIVSSAANSMSMSITYAFPIHVRNTIFLIRWNCRTHARAHTQRHHHDYVARQNPIHLWMCVCVDVNLNGKRISRSRNRIKFKWIVSIFTEETEQPNHPNDGDDDNKRLEKQRHRPDEHTEWKHLKSTTQLFG